MGKRCSQGVRKLRRPDRRTRSTTWHWPSRRHRQEKEGDRLETAFRFGAALRSFWQVRGYFREGRAFLERVLAHGEGSLSSWRAKALNDAVLLAVSQGDHAWGEALCQQNLVYCRALGDNSAVARTLYLL